ncbi:MAG: DUF4957 domain-containing protein, partial [Bacteroidales bacterium]|nr:DUF4957 domain-containing protein [Bacteroidales bacterium]
MKKAFKYFALVLVSLLAFACSPNEIGEITDIDYNRVLTPMKFTAEVVPATGTDVVFSWQKIKNAEGYELEIYEHSETQAVNEYSGTPVAKYSVDAEQIPFTAYNLEVDKTFKARVRGISSKMTESNWAKLEKTFATSAVRSSLNPAVTGRNTNDVTIAWDDASDKADLTSVMVEPVVAREGDAPRTVALTSAQINAASATVGDLAAGREYRFTLLFGKAGKRGSVTACTRPVIDGTPIAVSTGAELLNAIDKQSGTITLLVNYTEAGLDVTSAYPDPTKKFATVVGDVSIYGNSTVAGKKPVVNGLVFDLTSGATKLHLEDVAFDGALTGSIVENISAQMSSIEIVNCEVFNYAKGIYTVASSASSASVQNYLVDGCYCHDINARGTEGGDFIDVRAATNGDFTVRNTTFYACARTFLRMSDNAKVGNVLVQNCTFNYVTATPTSSNNSGIFGVRVNTGAKSVKSIKNVFLNEYNDAETETTSWVRLNRNSSDSYRVVCQGNVYFNVGNAWYVSAAVATETDGMGEAEFETIAKNEATVLEEDPCVNSAAGKLYLTGSAGSQIKSLKAGDPRWWDAVQPVVIRETELTLVEEDYTWDFTEKTIYDTEELTTNTIIGNTRIYATETVPANVVMSKGIDFSTTASVNPETGVPTYSAVEILTSGYGSVKVTGTSDDGVGTIQVLAGGDRYALLADGEEHIVNLGDLSGENSIYVIADSQITLQKVVWTKDLTPEVTVETLKTPAVTITPNKLDEGTAEAVVISWAEVENAADYVFTFNGLSQTLTEPQYTIPAEEVAMLAVGEYPVSVMARPVETSTKYAESAVAEALLKINKVVSGGEVTLTWDFSSSQWQTEFQNNAASANATNQAGWTVSVDGLTYTSGTKNGKWDPSGYIQPNGSGSTTERVFSFNAPADGVLKVTAGSASAGNVREYVVVDASGAEQTKGVDAQETLEFDIKAGDVFVYPKAGIRFYVFEFTYVSGAPIQMELDWNFASAEWQAEFQTNAASANATNQAGWTVSLDGLTYTSGTKNGKWDPSGFIQPNGSGSTTERVFSFTAPADGTLIVTAGSASAGNAREYVVVDATGTEQTKSVDAQEAIEFDIKAGEVLIYPKAGIRFYEFKFNYTVAGGPAASSQEWDFSSAGWQAEFQANAASANATNQAGWTVSLDGLTYTSGTKNGKWDPSGFIQPNGSGSTTERVFSFTAPA